VNIRAWKKKTAKKQPPTAAETILIKQAELEDDLLRRCKAFERATGMSVRAVRLPGEHDFGRPGYDPNRVVVMIAPPERPPAKGAS
jgi:hypothetical protein